MSDIWVVQYHIVGLHVNIKTAYLFIDIKFII